MKKQLIAFAVVCVFLGSAAYVSAQEKMGTRNWEDWDITIGLGGEYEPVSPGVDETEFSVQPLVDIEYKNRFFIKSDTGIGAYLLRSDEGFEYLVGVAVGYDDGREERRLQKVQIKTTMQRSIQRLKVFWMMDF